MTTGAIGLYPAGNLCECERPPALGFTKMGTPIGDGITRRREENQDRVRTLETCARCGMKRYGVFAKRLDDDGREAWGTVGRWSISLARGAPS